MKKITALMLTVFILVISMIPSAAVSEKDKSERYYNNLMAYLDNYYLINENWGEPTLGYDVTSLVVILDMKYSEDLDIDALFKGAEYYGILACIPLTPSDTGGPDAIHVRVGLYEDPESVDWHNKDACIARMKKACDEFLSFDCVRFVHPLPYIDWAAVSTVSLDVNDDDTVPGGSFEVPFEEAIKAYPDAVYDEEEGWYSNERLIVTIKHEYSGLAKEWHAGDFPKIGISKIEYITTLKDGKPEDYPLIIMDTYRQQLLVFLSGDSEIGIKEAKALLEKNEYVASVAFDHYYYYSLDDMLVKDTVSLDVNSDGKVNAKDVSALMKQIVGTNIPDAALDINGDGNVNAKDVSELMKAIIA